MSMHFCEPAAATITLADRQQSKLAAYDYFLTRAAERAGNAEVRGKMARAHRYNRLQKWLKARLTKVKAEVQHGPPDRAKFITTRIVPFSEKGFYDGQSVTHRTGGMGVVVGVDCEAGWVTVNTEDGRQLWRVSETRKKKGVKAVPYLSLLK